MPWEPRDFSFFMNDSRGKGGWDPLQQLQYVCLPAGISGSLAILLVFLEFIFKIIIFIFRPSWSIQYPKRSFHSNFHRGKGRKRGPPGKERQQSHGNGGFFFLKICIFPIFRCQLFFIITIEKFDILKPTSTKKSIIETKLKCFEFNIFETYKIDLLQ